MLTNIKTQMGVGGMTEYRKMVHNCWMKGNATEDDCAACMDCIDEPYELSEFIPQLRAMVKVWRRGKAKGWTRGEIEPKRNWILQMVMIDPQGHKHWLNADRNGNARFSAVHMNCF